uniref:Acetylcholinesterase n=1 Tax=Strongyloides venezuelensis TaxID=75913 RepID=A0A0K0FXC8_STRVS
MFLQGNFKLLLFLYFLSDFVHSYDKNDGVKVKFSMKEKGKTNVDYVNFIPNYIFNFFRINIVKEYLGVPYARPPIDYFRFKRPHPHYNNITDDRVFKANTPATPCLQRHINTGVRRFDYYSFKNGTSEDCLQMNMWVPENKTGAVIVFFHGGDLVRGSASLDIYNGSFLAAYSKAIIVNVNYRLEVYGFAYLGRKTRIPGNMGLLDQQRALLWVNEHIKDFGGDPNKVTIFGHEAGAVAAAAHLHLKDKKLFKRVILLSGAFPSRRFTVSHFHVINRTKELGELMICKNQTNTLVEACLSQREVTTIHRFTNYIRHKEDYPLRHIFGISSSDRWFFTKNIAKLYIRDGVDILTGRNEDEGTQYFLDFIRKNFQHLENYKKNFDNALKEMEKINAKLFAKIAKEHKLKKEVEKNLVETYVKLTNKTYLIGPLLYHDMHSECDWHRFINKALSKPKNKIYSYIFKHIPKNEVLPHWLPNVVTGSDTEYIFGLPFREFRTKNYKFDNFTLEAALSVKMMNMVGRFADTGIPGEGWELSKKGLIKSAVLSSNYAYYGVLKHEVYKSHGRCRFFS